MEYVQFIRVKLFFTLNSYKTVIIWFIFCMPVATYGYEPSLLLKRY